MQEEGNVVLRYVPPQKKKKKFSNTSKRCTTSTDHEFISLS